MTTILQISDTHIVPEGVLVSGRLDTWASLRNLVRRVEGLRAQIGPIDGILVSGDLSDDGSAASYRRFKETLASLDLPLFVIPGNHDARETMRAAFIDDKYLPPVGKLNWTRRVGDIVIIGLDTLVEGQGGGVLDAPTLAFLAKALHDAGSTPVMLSMHHPPFRSGIRFMDDIGLQGIDALTEVLSGHVGEMRIVCGHIHCMMIANVGSRIAMSSPSPCSTFAFDIRAEAPVGYLDKEDGFLIHRWQNGFQSVQVDLSRGPGPFPF